MSRIFGKLFAGIFLCATLLPMADAYAAEFKVLYSFAGGTDGANPVAGLIDVKGTLYGTTQQGGENGARICSGNGCGTVFAIDPRTGAETMLHSFATDGDGWQPDAALTNVNGMLYGTTFNGGSQGEFYGTVFAFDPQTDTETVVHSFPQNGTDGANPESGLVKVGANLYGTTVSGGSSNCFSSCGTVFAFDPKTAAVTIVYPFEAPPDGQSPWGDLAAIDGKLYGTTSEGGAHAWGTVFAVDPQSGTDTVLHSFDPDGSDGAEPFAGLTNLNGLLYGTTFEGGTHDKGTIFAVDPATGTETVLYSFSGGADGERPDAGLINVNGKLYGTTFGSTIHLRRCVPDGCGTVFEFDPQTGAMAVLHYFDQPKHGSHPSARLLSFKGKLYGTTEYGGAYHYGTVFSIKP